MQGNLSSSSAKVRLILFRNDALANGSSPGLTDATVNSYIPELFPNWLSIRPFILSLLPADSFPASIETETSLPSSDIAVQANVK